MLYESYYGVSSLGYSLEHHGIKGQKWGVRRFQYEDGLLTPAGRARYDVGPRERTGKSARKSTAKNVAANALRGAAIGLGAASYRKLRTGNVSNPLPGMLKGAAAGAAVGAAGTAAYAASRNSKGGKKKLSAKEKAQRKEMAKKIAKGVAIGAAVGVGTAIAAKKIKDINFEKEQLQHLLNHLDTQAQLNLANNNMANSSGRLTPLGGRDMTKMSRNELRSTIMRTRELNAAFDKSGLTIHRVQKGATATKDIFSSSFKTSVSDLKKKNKSLFNNSIDSILKDMPRTFANMTMDDLRKLDLY